MEGPSSSSHTMPEGGESISSSLPPPGVDPEGTTALLWDTETDHMLSYFLGGFDPTTAGAPVATATFTTALGGVTEEDRSSQRAAAASTTGHSSNHWLPPPTPAVQFYSNSTPQSSNVYRNTSSALMQQRPTHPDLIPPQHVPPQHPIFPPTSLAATSQSSSSSSLSSLPNGGAMLMAPSFYQRLFPPGIGTDGESPLTPSALLGHEATENLFLPRSNSFYEMSQPSSMGPPVPRPPTVYTGATPNEATTTLHSYQPMRSSSAIAEEGESEEKRTKRLERNRESARKCRWKKKERLRTLSAQVTECHAHIERQRRQLIDDMVPALQQCRRRALTLDNGAWCIRHTGPSSPLMRSVLEFQYSSLKDLVLPNYQIFLLWLSRQPESFFTAAKTNGSNSSSSGSSNSKSSKQVGEELVVGGTTAAAADAAPLVWPLLCAELKLSVDQEERWLAQHKRSSRSAGVATTTAAPVTEHLGRAVGALSHRLAQREEGTLLHILQPAQLLRYQAWWTQRGAVRVQTLPGGNDAASADLSLPDMCRRLSEVLRISEHSSTAATVE